MSFLLLNSFDGTCLAVSNWVLRIDTYGKTSGKGSIKSLALRINTVTLARTVIFLIVLPHGWLLKQ